MQSATYHINKIKYDNFIAPLIGAHHDKVLENSREVIYRLKIWLQKGFSLAPHFLFSMLFDVTKAKLF